MKEEAFSGIYVMNRKALEDLCGYSRNNSLIKFPIMDYLLTLPGGIAVRRWHNPRLRVLDVGKPDALLKASTYI